MAALSREEEHPRAAEHSMPPGQGIVGSRRTRAAKHNRQPAERFMSGHGPVVADSLLLLYVMLCSQL